ncbi:AbiJ-NTD4 domain-containing protein [uncultured Dubosiella sp.]|uniref:AbiJ-NTD4 domain-containing protein n=1 Tax=uncultured Dubosiella sp. TaxID=1937011 RepID=UPI0027300CD3|nr:hypothetical protein [uncultured Dubosiella sp.]
MNYTLYSQRLDANQKHDGWIYDRFPATFRTQLVYIVRDLPVKEPFWQRFNQWFEREKGWTPKIYFIQESSHPQRKKLEYRLEQLDDFEFLDLIDGLFHQITKTLEPADWNDAVQELNRRFEQHRLGYFFSQGHIQRKG